MGKNYVSSLGKHCSPGKDGRLDSFVKQRDNWASGTGFVWPAESA